MQIVRKYSGPRIYPCGTPDLHELPQGIFVITPSIVQSMAGPATCISYLLSGFAAALSVLCYSDLAGRYVELVSL